MTLERHSLATELKPSIHIMIALDIDDTLASPIEEDDLKKNYMSWFRENDLIVDAIAKHIIHPGVIEFIRYLYEHPNIKFCFFSHGEAKRNHPFVSQLLKRALCDKKYKHAMTEKEFKDYEESIQAHIFSRNDCSYKRGSYYKDLKITLKLGCELDSTILIDDQRTNLSNGQKRHGLIISYADDIVFKDASEKPFDDSLTEQWCRADNIRSVNHIFYVAGLLEKVLANPSRPITNKLFELQYKEDGVESLWLEKYGVALTTVKNRESMDISALKSISYQYDNIPVLIRVFDTNELLIFGKPNARDWSLTSLDSRFIEKFNFPCVFNESRLLERPYNFEDFRQDEMALHDEIKSKNGHTVIKYEPRFDLYKDKSLYVSGLQTLQRFATTPLEFYGYDANQFFGLKKDITMTDAPTFWAKLTKSMKRKETNFANKTPTMTKLS